MNTVILIFFRNNLCIRGITLNTWIWYPFLWIKSNIKLLSIPKNQYLQNRLYQADRGSCGWMGAWVTVCVFVLPQTIIYQPIFPSKLSIRIYQIQYLYPRCSWWWVGGGCIERHFKEEMLWRRKLGFLSAWWWVEGVRGCGSVEMGLMWLWVGWGWWRWIKMGFRVE